MSELKMPTINQVAVSGRLVQDPESRKLVCTRVQHCETSLTMHVVAHSRTVRNVIQPVIRCEGLGVI